MKVGHRPGEIQTSFVPAVRRKRTVNYLAGNRRDKVCLCRWNTFLWYEWKSFFSLWYKLAHCSGEKRRSV